MKFSKSLNSLYHEVKKSIVNESTILMQGDDAASEVEEFNGVTGQMLNKIRRLLGTQQKSSQETLINYLTADKKISESLAKRIALYIEHYSEDPQKIIDYILDDANKISLQTLTGGSENRATNMIELLEGRGFNKELIETLITLREQGSGPGEYLFCVAIQNLQKREKAKKKTGNKDDDGGDLELIGGGGGKVELKANSGILRSGKENKFGTPIQCSIYWRKELEDRLLKYGMKEALEELPKASAKPGAGKNSELSFKLNQANRVAVDIFGQQISKRLEELKNKKTEFSDKQQYESWLKTQGVKLTPTEIQSEKFDEEDLVHLWAEGFKKLFLDLDINKIKEKVKEAYIKSAEDSGELGINIRSSLLLLNLEYYVTLDNFVYFVLFDHIQTSKTYGRALVLTHSDLASPDSRIHDLITIVSAPDFSRDVVSSGAVSIKINSSLLQAAQPNED